MAILSVPQRATIQSLVDYLAFNHDLPIDERVVTQLVNVFGGTLGFPCPCGSRGIDIATSFRDAPIQTFIKILNGISAPGTVISSPVPGLAGNGPALVELGTASGYDVLAGTSVTNTGGSVLSNDLGLSPGTSVTGFPPGTVLGTEHITDAAAAQAQLDLTVAYNDAAGRTLNSQTVAGNLAGTTLPPGLYKSTSTLAVTSGNLTLDAQGNSASTWIFQVTSALNIGNAAQIILAGGAKAANVVWQVGSSATIGTTAIFKGTVLALTSITVNTGAAVEGRLLARNGDVTLDSNAIVIPVGIPVPTPGVLPVISATDRTILQSLITYLEGNRDLPIDERVVDQLSRVFDGTSGFPCACGIRGNSLQVSFRDEPIRTFLRLIIAVSDATPGP